MNTQNIITEESESFTMFTESVKTAIPKNILGMAVKAVRKKLWKGRIKKNDMEKLILVM